MTHFLRLPIELRNEIELKLQLEGLYNLGRTCGQLYVETNPFWRSFLTENAKNTSSDSRRLFYTDIHCKRT